MEFTQGTLEGLVTPRFNSLRGRNVFVTGHTGFKGAWLALWLSGLGAKVHGYSLDPPTEPSLFAAAGVAQVLGSEQRADICDFRLLADTMAAVRPELVLHLAAQSLVRESYVDPLRTFATNVMGTANVLQAARSAGSVGAVIVVTTDKVYADSPPALSRREGDALGGHDPYSASKAAAEIVTASLRSSFFRNESDSRIATVRAGNVIGGGDWATDRLVPDCMRAFAKRDAVTLRYPRAIRPWQHVLEPLAGYLMLAERLLDRDAGSAYAEAWNFGPDAQDDASVGSVATSLQRLWGDGASVASAAPADQPHETAILRLDSGLARARLEWKPRWHLERTLEMTVDWYKRHLEGADARALCEEQIARYESDTNP